MSTSFYIVFGTTHSKVNKYSLLEGHSFRKKNSGEGFAGEIHADKTDHFPTFTKTDIESSEKYDIGLKKIHQNSWFESYSSYLC